jgi:hypothetical protein
MASGGLADLVTAFGLLLVLEGVVLALVAPGRIGRMLEALRGLPPGLLRAAGLAAAAAGLLIVWLVRG